MGDILLDINQDAVQAADIAAAEADITALEAVDLVHAAMLPLGGEAFVTPVHMQTSGDQAVQLDAGGDHVAFKWTPKADYALDSFSLYFTDIGTEGDLNAKLHAVAYTGYEPNGTYNGSQTNIMPTMTSNVLPAGYETWLVDSAGANAEAGAGFEAFEASDGSIAADNGTRSNAAPTAPNPIHFGITFATPVRINKWQQYSYNNADANVRAWMTAWTKWGSNVETPVKHTNDDWTQINKVGGTGWSGETDPGAGLAKEYYSTNATAYKHYRWTYTARAGANAYGAIGEIKAFAAQLGWVPGTELYDIGTVPSPAPAAADTWVRKTLTVAQQLQRGVEVCLDFYGTAAKDFSLSTRRWNSDQGSMFPDGCECKHNLGTGFYTQAEQNSKPAMLNIVINSTVNHCPKAWFGRTTGSSVYVPGVGVMTIPLAGISLACDDLTATDLTDVENATIYNLDLYSNSGTLALKQYTTDPILSSDGIEQEAANQRYVASFFVINRVSTKQGPIDVGDCVGLNWKGRIRSVFKENPYSSDTTEVAAIEGIWKRWSGNEDFTIVVLAVPTTWLDYTARLAYTTARLLIGSRLIGVSGDITSVTDNSVGYIANCNEYKIPSRRVVALKQYYKWIASSPTLYHYTASTGASSIVHGSIRSE